MFAFTHIAADRIVLSCVDPGVKAARLVGPQAVVRMIRLLAAVQLMWLPAASLLA